MEQVQPQMQMPMQMAPMPMGQMQSAPAKSHVARNVLIGVALAVVLVLIFDIGGIRTSLMGESSTPASNTTTTTSTGGGTILVGTGGSGTITTGTGGVGGTITTGTGGVGGITTGTGNSTSSAPASAIIAPVVLYTDTNFSGTATPIIAGRIIKIAEIGTGCDGNWGSLGCWNFLFKSLKADPGVNLVFRRSSGGHTYAMTLDPNDIGNIDNLTAEYLEGFVDPDAYKTSGAMEKTAVLPYVYWTDPLYLQVVKKPVSTN